MAGHSNDRQDFELVARDKETGETQSKFEFRPDYPRGPAWRPPSFKIPSTPTQRANACDRGTCAICRERGSTAYKGKSQLPSGSVHVDQPLVSPARQTSDSIPGPRLTRSHQMAPQHRRKRRSSSPRDITRSRASFQASGRVRPAGHLELSDELYSYLRHESLSTVAGTPVDVHTKYLSFRIPPSMLSFKLPSSSPPESRGVSAHKKQVNIQCWREFIMGRDAVTDQSQFSEKLICKYKTSIPCRVIQSVCERYVWQPLASMVGIMGILFMVFLPCVSIGLAYLYRLHVHRQIHALSEDLGVEVHYTGGPVEGPQAPLIYCIRHQSCARCCYSRQAKLHLKYHKTQKEERSKIVL